MTKESENKTLDYAASFNEAACKSLMEAVVAALGFPASVVSSKERNGPLGTVRQLARMVAVEAGFDPRCVGAVSKCHFITATNAGKQLLRRVEAEVRGLGSGQPLAPVVEKARRAAAEWLKGRS